MSPFDPSFAVAAFAVAVSYGHLLGRVAPLPAGHDRTVAIDGLRGILAFGVFLHHGAVWWTFLHTGTWRAPDSALFTHLGDSAVALFFMITAFLFTGKLLDERTVAWGRLYVGRVFRLMPLYLALMVVLVTIVAFETRQMNVKPLALVDELGRWSLLATFGMPLINKADDTLRIVAAVPWTLRYEVLFYATLPLLALLFAPVLRRRPRLAVVAIATAALVPIVFGDPSGEPIRAARLAGFVPGIVAAWLARRPAVAALARSRAAAPVAIACAVLAVSGTTSGYAPTSIALFGIAFAIVALGNDLFGALRTRAARALGEISYGIYLFHGTVLYLLFHAVVGEARAATLSPLAHWSLVIAAAPLVLGLATLGHFVVERPGIALGRRVAAGGGRATLPRTVRPT